MKFTAHILIPFALLSMTACGGSRNAGVGQPSNAEGQKQQQGERQAPTTNTTAPAANACDFAADKQPLKVLALSNIVTGKPGQYQLTAVAVFSRTNFSSTHKAFDYRLSSSSITASLAPAPRVACKNMAELPEANSKGSIQAPFTISRIDGSLKKADSISFEIFGEGTKLRDSLKASVINSSSQQNFSSYTESLSQAGTVKLVQLSDVEFQLRSIQGSESGDVKYQTEVRYTYRLEK